MALGRLSPFRDIPRSPLSGENLPGSALADLAAGLGEAGAGGSAGGGGGSLGLGGAGFSPAFTGTDPTLSGMFGTVATLGLPGVSAFTGPAVASLFGGRPIAGLLGSVVGNQAQSALQGLAARSISTPTGISGQGMSNLSFQGGTVPGFGQMTGSSGLSILGNIAAALGNLPGVFGSSGPTFGFTAPSFSVPGDLGSMGAPGRISLAQASAPAPSGPVGHVAGAPPPSPTPEGYFSGGQIGGVGGAPGAGIGGAPTGGPGTVGVVGDATGVPAGTIGFPSLSDVTAPSAGESGDPTGFADSPDVGLVAGAAGGPGGASGGVGGGVGVGAGGAGDAGTVGSLHRGGFVDLERGAAQAPRRDVDSERAGSSEENEGMVNVQDGEFVVNKEAAGRYGPLLNKLNDIGRSQQLKDALSTIIQGLERTGLDALGRLLR